MIVHPIGLLRQGFLAQGVELINIFPNLLRSALRFRKTRKTAVCFYISFINTPPFFFGKTDQRNTELANRRKR